MRKENVNIIVISQNVILESIYGLKDIISDRTIVVVSTQLLFENEKELLSDYFDIKEFLTFSNLLSDSVMECCDREAYEQEHTSLLSFYSQIKKLKNTAVIKELLDRYEVYKGFVLTDDLGIDLKTWQEYGFQYEKVEYYYTAEEMDRKSKVKQHFDALKNHLKLEIHVGKYNNKKYMYIGSLNRVGYRMDIMWRKSSVVKCVYIFQLLMYKISGIVIPMKYTVLSSMHESGRFQLPDSEKVAFKIIQDGYLPTNYSSLYMRFVANNAEYYAWDKIGNKAFQEQGVRSCIMPFRKKMYLPHMSFAKQIRNVLIVASGAGDWTAIKNRSDEDIMVVAFANLAEKFPEIKFIYRCHPAWIHPSHQGTNSIVRVAEYFQYRGLKNIAVSGNIPKSEMSDFQLSYERSTLDCDLDNADIVFGEHSISMIDAGLRGIPFASVNLTGRRDLFDEITKMGFPHFEKEEDIASMLSDSFCATKEIYEKAIACYNEITQCEV